MATHQRGSHTKHPAATDVELIVADYAGACFGVKRALELARETLAHSTLPVCTLGPLIHNPTVVGELASLGAQVVHDPSEAANAALILRSHGVSPQEERIAKQVSASVVDATCPFVKRLQKSITELECLGYQIILVGEHGHPEVEAARAYAHECLVVERGSELAASTVSSHVGVVVQTTQMRSRLREVTDALIASGHVRDLRVIDTICEATAERQNAAVDLARQVDAMVVIGGHNSANTCHLAELCAQHAPTYHVEHVAELCLSWFEHTQSIGITAGASTPQEQIVELAKALRVLLREQQ